MISGFPAFLITCGDSDCALKFIPTMVNDPVGIGADCPGSATPYCTNPTSVGSGGNITVPLPETSVVTGNDLLVPPVKIHTAAGELGMGVLVPQWNVCTVNGMKLVPSG